MSKIMGHKHSLVLGEVIIGYASYLVRHHLQDPAEFLGLSLFSCGAPSADEIIIFFRRARVEDFSHFFALLKFFSLSD